jgi:hypothetical protein
MTESIILTSDGDTLIMDEDDLLRINYVGVHEHCGGFIECRKISEIKYVLVCPECALRVVIPSSVKTNIDLRQHFHRLNPTKT